MFVKDQMTENPISIPQTMSVVDALDLMRRHGIRRLPVTHRGKLAGIVTERDLLKVSPSPATSLSVFELNFLIAKMTVGEIMAKPVFFVSPDTTIEAAALMMREHKIGGLPVLEKGDLVGIISESDLFEALIKLFGLKKPGHRLTIVADDKPGLLYDITRIVKDLNINIVSAATQTKDNKKTVVVLRLEISNPEEVVNKLKEAGFSVIHVSQ